MSQFKEEGINNKSPIMVCVWSENTRQKPRAPASQATIHPAPMQNNSFEAKVICPYGKPKRTFFYIFGSWGIILHRALGRMLGPDQLPVDRIRKGKRKKLFWLLEGWSWSFATGTKAPPDVSEFDHSCCWCHIQAFLSPCLFITQGQWDDVCGITCRF